MARHLHLISGLPRSGSTLLATILRQNPRFHAGMQSPLADIIRANVQTMSGAESASFISDEQRERILRGVLDSYYGDLPDETVVFDAHRVWCSMLSTVAQISPASRVVCCVRSPAWILDSLERLVRRNALRSSRIFGYESTNVYIRTESLTTKQLLAPSLQGLRQAWFSEDADKLILIRYDSLVERPGEVIDRLYDALGQTPFAHDFQRLEFSEPDFDGRLGLPGMHDVSGPVVPRRRQTILPPDIFSKHQREFWADENPRHVTVL